MRNLVRLVSAGGLVSRERRSEGGANGRVVGAGRMVVSADCSPRMLHRRHRDRLMRGPACGVRGVREVASPKGAYCGTMHVSALIDH